MSDPTEQDLVEALDPFAGFTAADRRLAIRVREGAELLAALRAALPEGVVLTSDGLARVEAVGLVRADCDDNGLPFDFRVEWDEHELGDVCPGDPLYTLTRIEDE